MRIESLQNEKVKVWNKLKEKKYRDETNLFLIEEEHLVLEALKKGMVKELLVTEKCDYDVPTYEVSKEIMKKLTSQVTAPKILAVCKKMAEKPIYGSVLFLDGIQDPGNLGTIIRSAVAFSMPNIILNENCVDLYNPKVIRSTEGMLFSINVLRRNTVECFRELKHVGYQIIGTDVIEGCNPDSVAYQEKSVLVIGSEGHGMSKTAREYCDTFVKIPMNSACESLNAGVSASILLYERSKKNGKY